MHLGRIFFYTSRCHLSTYSSDTPSLPTFLSLFLSLFFPFSNYASAESDSRGGSKLDPRPRFPHRKNSPNSTPIKCKILLSPSRFAGERVCYTSKNIRHPLGLLCFCILGGPHPQKYTPPPLLGVKIQIANPPSLGREISFLHFLAIFGESILGNHALRV